jgi:hypothetical protein
MTLANDNKRVKEALDACSNNVMMVDPEFNIVYMNPMAQSMIKTAELDLKKELPNFDANNLIGQNIDVFHKKPAHQRNMLAKLQDTYKTQITVGARTFSLIATPIFDDDKNRLGTVVEWRDKTIEVHIEKEVEPGSNMVNQSGQMLSDIVQAVDKVARMISDVSNAAVEQNSGISQINQAVSLMDEMTQQNAALVEENSAASPSMSEEANSMSRLISFFQLGKQAGFASTDNPTHEEKIMTYQAPSTNKPNKNASLMLAFLFGFLLKCLPTYLNVAQSRPEQLKGRLALKYHLNFQFHSLQFFLVCDA